MNKEQVKDLQGWAIAIVIVLIPPIGYIIGYPFAFEYYKDDIYKEIYSYCEKRKKSDNCTEWSKDKFDSVNPNGDAKWMKNFVDMSTTKVIWEKVPVLNAELK